MKFGDAKNFPLHFRCPFCSGGFGLTLPDDPRPAIGHTLPYCREFAEKDPLTFLAAVNHENERVAGVGGKKGWKH